MAYLERRQFGERLQSRNGHQLAIIQTQTSQFCQHVQAVKTCQRIVVQLELKRHTSLTRGRTERISKLESEPNDVTVVN